MKIVSIAHRRTDLLLLQKAAWLKYVPEAEFLVAAHGDHKLTFTPDITLEYDSDPEYTLWPQNFLLGVDQILARFDEDIVIVEGDIFPVKPFDIADMFNPGTIRRYGQPYPGLLFMPRARVPFDGLTPLDWVFVKDGDGTLPFPITDDMRYERIGEHFLHWNNGDVGFRLTPQHDPRNAVLKKFYEWFGIEDQYTGELPPAVIPKKIVKGRLSVQDRQVREEICRACESLNQKSMCLKIRNSQGCGACTQPWTSSLIMCPQGKWPAATLETDKSTQSKE